ncbi:hypothetical protein T02_12852 [Trichinella nativa]|uniref:Uncharacterized protein n=1 Tax=Trichinella nativa TaxID=6335 RepID=A0A0V1KLQ5_9BILA|nr:hypothetical protein T02_12852 [Trichinella nativa]
MTVPLLQTNRLRHKTNYFKVNSTVLYQQLIRKIVKSNSRLRQLRAAALIAGCTLAFFTIQAVAKLPNSLFRVQRSSGGRCMGSLRPQPGAARHQESDLVGDARVLFLLYPRPFGTSPWAGHTDEHCSWYENNGCATPVAPFVFLIENNGIAIKPSKAQRPFIYLPQLRWSAAEKVSK